MKKGLVISFILLAFFLLWEFPALAVQVKIPTISSISPTGHAEGSFAVTLTGNNFIGVKAVTPISATTRTAAKNVPFVVNSIGKITATVALAADTYYFQVTTKLGTATSPNLVVTSVMISPAPAPGTTTGTTTGSTPTPTTEPAPAPGTTTESTTTPTTQPATATEPTNAPTTTPTTTPTPTPTPTLPIPKAQSYRLKSPIPAVVNAGPVSEGVSTSGYRTMWRGPDNQVHLLAAFGGDTNCGWFGHYINMNTGAHAMITGPSKGAARRWTYNPSVDRVYIATSYAQYNESLWEFNPADKSLVMVSPTADHYSSLNLLTGDDNRVYWATQYNKVFSYDHATATFKDYGTVLPGLQNGSNYFSLGADSGYIYCGVLKLNGTWTLAISPTTGSPNFKEWEFGNAGDTNLSIGLNENHTEHKWTVSRTLSNGTQKYYALSGGSYTELTPGQSGYTWSVTPPNPPFLQGEYHYDRGPSYCIAASDENSYPLFASTYKYEVDMTDFFPIKGIHEFTAIKYRATGSPTWLESTLPFTGPWVPQPIQCLALNNDHTVFAVSAGYNACTNIDYLADLTTYMGGNNHSPYSALNHPSGDIYVGGYANRVMRYNPDLPWTLTSANSSPKLPSDMNKPNPYFIQMPAPLLHYRHGLAYDANWLVWIGGNTTRQSKDYGDVMWYNPTSGSAGYMFPEWAASGTMFRSLCTANNGARICVSDNAGNIWIIDAASKMVDPTPIIPVAASKTYMIEVENDIVFGIVFAPGPTYKVIRFRPSTKEILTLQDLGVSGTPFGFGDNQYSRMDYKLEKGPDGYIWMFVGNSLYRVDPTTCVFSKVLDNNYAKLKFASNNVDLLLYSINGTTDFKYIPGILEAVAN